MPIILWLLAHAAGDYLLQGDYLATGKGRSWWLMAMHSLAYAFPFAVLMGLSGGIDQTALAVLAGSHFVVDSLKARYSVWQALWEHLSFRYNTYWAGRLMKSSTDRTALKAWKPGLSAKAQTFAELVDQAIHMAIIAALVAVR